MTHGCGCTSNPMLQGIEESGKGLSRRALLGAGAALGVLALGRNVLAEDAPAGAGGRGAADTIFHGGPIVTMVKDGQRVEALAVRSGQILLAGTKADVLKRKGAATKLVDLKGRCMMPGFIDPHSHVVLQSAKFATANLDPKPIGDIGTMADLKETLRSWIGEQKIDPGKWVVGWGYDDTGIKEMRHPTKKDLDEVSTEHPIVILHISCHLMAVNSKALEEIGVDATTKDPEGGKFQRLPGGNEPSGVLEELAMEAILGKLPAPTPEHASEIIAKGLAFYAAAGITTAQDGATGSGTAKLLAAMDQAGKLPIDVVGYPLYKAMNDEVMDAIVADKTSTGRFRLGGVKMTVDGSIQGYTAFLSKPYFVQPGGEEALTQDACSGETAEHCFVTKDTPPADARDKPTPKGGHRGYSNMTQDEIEHWVTTCDKRDVQFLAHTNGDAATDMLVEAIEKVRGDKPRKDLRTTIIHAQTMREDQLDVAAKHGLCPSFFPIHVYFWGDRHRDIFLGPERAARISPAKSALDRGMKFTLHHDAPVAGIGMLPVAAAAVNRKTSSGAPLGLDQKITPFQALRAITHDAAWQYFQEDRKGTLEVGKVADLVILEADPLAIDPAKMSGIRVLETIKDGKTVFRLSED
ncbi:MAG: amidohydrolase [Planctomycetota bacterium]|nr:amidohydrolase [Planctomycetota bacterium]